MTYPYFRNPRDPREQYISGVNPLTYPGVSPIQEYTGMPYSGEPWQWWADQIIRDTDTRRYPSRRPIPGPASSVTPQMGLLSPDYSPGLISFQQMQGWGEGKQRADEIRTALANKQSRRPIPGAGNLPEPALTQKQMALRIAGHRGGAERTRNIREDVEFFGDQPGLAGVPNPHLDRFSGGYSRTYPAAPSRQLRSSYITPGLEQQITPQKLGPAGSGSNMVGPFAQKGARDPFERYPTFSGVDRFATRPRDIPDVDVLPGSIPPGYAPTFPGGGPSGTSQLGTAPRRGAEDSYLSWLKGDRASGWQWGEKPLTATEAYGVSIAANMIPTHDQPRLIKGGGSFGGVAKGAAMGSPYGPYGTAIGGALGLLGAFDTKSPPEQSRTVWSRGASPGFPTQTTRLI